jgi:hypothetical protein
MFVLLSKLDNNENNSSVICFPLESSHRLHPIPFQQGSITHVTSLHFTKNYDKESSLDELKQRTEQSNSPGSMSREAT